MTNDHRDRPASPEFITLMQGRGADMDEPSRDALTRLEANDMTHLEAVVEAAVEAERKRCARVVEALASPFSPETATVLTTAAAAIRGGPEAE